MRPKRFPMKQFLFYILILFSIASYSRDDETKIKEDSMYYWDGNGDIHYTKDEWQYVLSNEKFKYEIKPALIKNIGQEEFKFWVKITYDFDFIKNRKLQPISYTLEQWQIAINKDKIRITPKIDYNSNGNAINTNNNMYYEDVIPESIGEHVYNWVLDWINKYR